MNQPITKVGTLVQHVPTLARGEVIDPAGGYRPRVDWGGRISRVHVDELRVVGERPTVYELINRT